MYKASIHITLRESILDPQGKATLHALHNLGYGAVDKVRMGKYVEMWVEAANEGEARDTVEKACSKLMANPVMEDYSFSVEPV